MITRGIPGFSSIRALYSCSGVALLNLSAEVLSTIAALALVILAIGASTLMLAFRPSPRHQFIIDLLERLNVEKPPPIEIPRAGAPAWTDRGAA